MEQARGYRTGEAGPGIAGETVLRLAARRGDATRQAVRERLTRGRNVRIQRQKFDQWCDGVTSFPNDFAQLMTEEYGLDEREQVELALALSYGQRTRLLRK